MNVNISKQELKEIVKDSVKEAVSSEFMNLRASSLSFVSENEQKEIEKEYGAPSYEKGKEEEEIEA